MGEVIYLRPETRPQVNPIEEVLALRTECDELRDEFAQPNSLVTAEDVVSAENELIERLGQLTNAQLQRVWRMMNESSSDGAA